MYSIMHIIYGLPLVQEVADIINELEERPETEDDADEINNWHEDDNGACGFTQMYSGSGEFPPGYCGVELDCFDECSDYKLVSSLNLVPTPQQVELARLKIETNLSQRIKDKYKELGIEPDVYVVFSTS